MSMESQPRPIRRRATNWLTDFDDQLWPIHLAVVVLAGCVAAVIASVSDFNDPRILSNGWVRMASVVLIASMASWSAVLLQQKVTRRVQLCIIASLLVHFGLALFLHDQYLIQKAQAEAQLARQLAKIPDPVTVPDYHWQQFDQPEATQPFEKMVETDAPEESDPNPPEAAKPEESPPINLLEPVEFEPPQKPRPEHVHLARAETSAPRRSEVPTGEQISRQEWKHRPEPNEPIPQPKIHVAGRRSQSELQPQVSIDRKSAQTPQHQRQTFDVQPSDIRHHQVKQLNRRAPRDSVTVKRPSTPTPTRQIFRIAEMPTTLARSPQPVQAIHAPRTRLDARPQVTLRQQTVPETVHRSDDPNPALPRQIVQPLALHRHSDPQPDLNDTPQTNPVRKNPQVADPVVSLIEPNLKSTPASSIRQQVSLDAAKTPLRRRSAIRSLPESLKESVELTRVDAPTKIARPRPRHQRMESSSASAFSIASEPVARRPRRLAPAQVQTSTHIVAPSTPSRSAKPSGTFSLDAPPSKRVRAPMNPTPSAMGRSDGSTRPAMTGMTGDLVQKLLVESASTPGPAAVTPGSMIGPRRLPHDRDDGPRLAARIGGALNRKTISPGLPRGLADTDLPEQATTSTDQGSDLDVLAGTRVGQPSRHEGGLPVLIAANTGPGGLRKNTNPLIGIADRHARPDSDFVQPISRRFVLPRTSGALAMDGHIRETAAPFRQRDPGQRARASLGFGGSEQTEQAVELGLKFFAQHQFADGRWALDRVPDRNNPVYLGAGFGQMHSDTAGTGLALLTFLGAGYTHLDDKHRETVRKGLEWLIGNQQADGTLFNDQSDKTRFARSYAHGIASIALCEAYGMTHDQALREPAQKAIACIVSNQSPTLGGWRYSPLDHSTEWPEESDTSVSGWHLMALKSAQMAGLEVPEESLKKISGWLDRAQIGDGGQYAYNPFAPDTQQQRHGRSPNLAMTAEGMLMRLYLGYQRDNPSIIRGADYLKANLPEAGSVDQSSRDVYYWYYATQVMFQMQGDYWDNWNSQLKPLLIADQIQEGKLAGSWAPHQPTPDRWGNAGGRHYVTALNLLMLEVYYRHLHLPLYRALVE